MAAAELIRGNMNPEQQEQMASDIREIKQAVIGDKTIGLNGLVDDMKEMKEFRNKITIKMAVVSGIVSGAVLGGKAAIAKFFGGQ